MPGKLHVVVGPSGSGKDTLMAGAKPHLTETVFAMRTITRPEDAGGEAINSVSQSTFDDMVANGEFCVHWSANNLCYGIPNDIKLKLSSGKHVVFNGSRGALQSIQACFPDVQIIWITVSPSTLEARLRARGRECEADIKARLARQNWEPPSAAIVIDNNGTLNEGIQKLIAALSGQLIALDEIKAPALTFTAEAEV